MATATDEEKKAAQTLRGYLAKAVAEKTENGDLLTAQRMFSMPVREFLDMAEGRASV